MTLREAFQPDCCGADHIAAGDRRWDVRTAGGGAFYWPQRDLYGMWQDELDILNRDTQDVFGVTVQVRREVKGALNIETGATPTVSSSTISVRAVRGEPRTSEFSPGGGGSQHVVEVVYEILTKDLRGESAPLNPGVPSIPPGPIRKGDIIIDPSLLVYADGDHDGQAQELVVRRVDLSVDRRFYIVTARGSEKR